MADEKKAARSRFDQALAARGEGRLTDVELTWLEDKNGQPLEELDARDFVDAVGDVTEGRATFSPRKRRTLRNEPRAEQLPGDSALAGPQWRAYLKGHLERVLLGFTWLRDDARLKLALQPINPGAPSTRRAAWAWLTGDTRAFEVDGADEELEPLMDREATFWWLAEYIAAQGDSGGSEVLLWRGLTGEDVALPFPASCYPLRNLRDLARHLAGASGCRESEAVEWLLADIRPELPSTLLVTSYPSLVEFARDPDGEPTCPSDVSRRYVITVSSGLISPDEVASIYRRARNRDYGLPTDPSARQTIWSAELVRCVARERRQPAPGARLPSWGQLLAHWNELYPQHPYGNPRAIRSSYLQATSRQEERGREKEATP